MPETLILTLYSGENEFLQCIDALKKQSYQDYDHQVIKDLPNKEAHDKLYRTIMRRSEEYGMFVKLDADMVFGNQNALEQIREKLLSSGELDQIIVPVEDFLSGRRILGMHAFSNRVSWRMSDEALFVDPSPDFPGKRHIWWDTEWGTVLHSPHPSQFQAFLFGYHRMLKAKSLWSGRAISQALFQWDILSGIYGRWRHAPESEKLAFACIGASHALLDGPEMIERKTPDSPLLPLFEKARKLAVEERRRFIQVNLGAYVRWHAPLARSWSALRRPNS